MKEKRMSIRKREKLNARKSRQASEQKKIEKRSEPNKKRRKINEAI